MKQNRIEKASNVLWISLKRFEQIPIARKITKVVKISKTLNLTDFQNNRGRELRYRLVAVISHIGNSLGDGHYTTIVKNIQEVLIKEKDFKGLSCPDHTFRLYYSTLLPR
jgi:ubiquitin C-terminal hydrolase